MILDITNPNAPVVVGQTGALPGVVSGLAVAGNYAYVSDGDAGLRIVDVTTTTCPEEVGFHNTPGLANGVGQTLQLAYHNQKGPF